MLTGTEDELAVAAAVADSGLRWTHVRPVEYMANKLQWAEVMRREGAVRAPFATQPQALVHEADVAAVIVVALLDAGQSGKTLIPTGPEALSPVDVARRIGQLIGREITFVEQTADEAREEIRAAGLQEEVIDFVIEYRAHPPEISYTVLPTVQDVTGRPTRTFDQWVAEHADAFRSTQP